MSPPCILLGVRHVEDGTDALLLVKVQKMADMSTTKRTPGAPPPLEFPPFLYGKLTLPWPGNGTWVESNSAFAVFITGLTPTGLLRGSDQTYKSGWRGTTDLVQA